ncbi:MAG: aminotransferase [Clostridiaceae bacterium]|jgi:DNA-binding transcriptional MocR family regulator|nr:aminotransferase [Eubacteriales bacterium]NLV48125.1 aminotransferase [Clostridiaceae bacterium]
MTAYKSQSDHDLQNEVRLLEKRVKDIQGQHLKLNMTRGKPNPDQLSLSSKLANCLDSDDFRSEDGTDCRNYGGLEGLMEIRRLFADLLKTKPDKVLVLGPSSLTIMYDMLVRCLLNTLPDGERPWIHEKKIKFLCPVPGYDRHFYATESLGIEMIPVMMTEHGPDMDRVEALVSSDPQIKGLWAVPQYSNPQGITYSDETCHRLSAMKTAAPDFRLFWDHAYVVHHLYPDDPSDIPDIVSLCELNGHPNRVFEFASTSKITWAGSGVACLVSSDENLVFIRHVLAAQMIGPDKMNQLRHARFLKSKETVEALMRQHADILRPKFEKVDEILSRELSDLAICSWQKPKGGYFFSLDLLPGTASETVSLAKSCGIELTPAGSTWPYRKDPDDSNLRLAPSFPTLPEITAATEVLTVCIRLAAARKIMADRQNNL